jgi:hypothetical protein
MNALFIALLYIVVFIIFLLLFYNQYFFYYFETMKQRLKYLSIMTINHNRYGS